MSKSKDLTAFTDPTAPKTWSARFIVALALMALGIAWMAYYYVGVRPDPATTDEPGGPAFLGDLGNWNYLIGFGLLLLGLVVSAHPDTPLGRNRGVVIGMVGCFVLGLIWICLFYLFSNDPETGGIPVMNDLGQKNLFVGIGFMAVGFAFATRWE